MLAELAALPPEAPLDGDDVYGAVGDFPSGLPLAEDESFDCEDPDFLAGLGVPADELSAPFAWDGWTAGKVRQALPLWLGSSRPPRRRFGQKPPRSGSGFRARARPR